MNLSYLSKLFLFFCISAGCSWGNHSGATFPSCFFRCAVVQNGEGKHWSVLTDVPGHHLTAVFLARWVAVGCSSASLWTLSCLLFQVSVWFEELIVEGVQHWMLTCTYNGYTCRELSWFLILFSANWCMIIISLTFCRLSVSSAEAWHDVLSSGEYANVS